MNTKIKPWKVIAVIEQDGSRRDEAVIVHVEDLHYWSIALPQRTKSGSRLKHHIPAPQRVPTQLLQARIDQRAVELHDVERAGLQAMTVTDIELLAKATQKPRARNVSRALDIMHMQWYWIQQYIERAGAGVDALLNTRAITAYARLAAQKHKVHPKRIVRSIRAYLMGGMRIQALLPAWDRSGAPGEQRLPRQGTNGQTLSRPGRRNVAVRAGETEGLGVLSTEDVRDKLRMGYRKFKTSKSISLEQAYYLTLGTYWAESVDVTERGRRIKLLPLDKLPTFDQFRRHGPGRDHRRSARRINIGEHRWELNHRERKGSERDLLKAAGQCATIDSTSNDQHLVLSVDRNVVMPMSWNTKVRENYTGYIASIYSGFEPPSTLTSLIAIGLATESKVEFCKRYGVSIKEDDWLSLNFRRIRADNGELKSEVGVQTLSGSSISAEFVKAYAADRKGGVESAHYQLQSGATHQLPGSTLGKPRQRGDADPLRDACLTHDEYMYHVITWVLKYNNVDRVESLLTLEMRRENVEPTRASILKWMIKKGYVVTDAPNQQDLRVACFPKLKGKLYRDGIRIFDPSTRDSRLIPGLRYHSTALSETGLTDRGTSVDLEIRVNPADISKVWIRYRGLIEASLITHDPELASLSLCEWLLIAESDRLANYLSKERRLQVLANDGVARYDSKERAMKEKHKQATSESISKGQRVNKRQAAALQASEDQRRCLGIETYEKERMRFTPANDEDSTTEPAWVAQARASLKRD